MRHLSNVRVTDLSNLPSAFVYVCWNYTSLQIVTPFNVKIRLLKWTAVTEGMDIPPHIAPRQINTKSWRVLIPGSVEYLSNETRRGCTLCLSAPIPMLAQAWAGCCAFYSGYRTLQLPPQSVGSDLSG